MEADDTKINVEQWKIKRLIKKLLESKGNGTSMISLVIPQKKNISDTNKLLNEELGTATNIKSAANKKSVITAITSAKERLKLYPKTPPNGLILFCGQIYSDDGKTEKKILIDFEPFRPINTSMYLCDNKFHVNFLKELLECDETYGFIVVDGNGALYGTLQGSTKEILHKFTVELPKKHGRGGQSSVRFARLRVEKRHNYLRKVCEIATQVFITQDKPNVNGLVLAGCADFKTDLMNSDMFDQRLKPKVLKIVDVSYGGENGFQQAVELSQECLASVRFVQEKKILSNFFSEIATDSGKYCYGVEDTLKSLVDIGAVETLLLFEGLDYFRVVLRPKDFKESNDKITIKYISGEELTDPKHYKDPETNLELESVEQCSLPEWLAENYSNYGARLIFITNKSPEGFQFVKGFGGIGGFLRYKLNMDDLGDQAYVEQIDDDFI